MSSEHQFDRRQTDANVASLSLRVQGLEGRVGKLERDVTDNTNELRANTKLTKQVHECLYGREDDDYDSGLKGKVKEVHDAFSDAKRGFAMLNKLAETGAKWGKPLLFAVAIGGAAITWWKTGEFHWPQ